METIYAKGIMRKMQRVLVRAGIVIACLLLYMLVVPIFLGTNRTTMTVFIMVCIACCIYKSGAYPCIKVYCTNRIKYGDGKVIIKRVRKEYVDGRADGKWKKGEEEFLLKDLDSCGMSLEVLGEHVECSPVMKRGVSSECFFELKSGKRLGCETGFYLAEDLERLFGYIYEETGIRFQGTLGKDLEGEKEAVNMDMRNL